MQECGNCTLCCKLLETHDVKSEMNVYCRYCKPNVGCTIHSERPNECRQYQCMWSQMENVSVELRPDNCGIIFDKISDKTICSLLDPEQELDDKIKMQIDFFLSEGLSVIVRKGDNKLVHKAEGHTMEEIKRDFNGSSQLYKRSN